VGERMNDFSIHDPLSCCRPMGHFTEMIILGSRGESSPLQNLNHNKIVPDNRSSIMVAREISLTSQKSSFHMWGNLGL
jgi:hypothetical protein